MTGQANYSNTGESAAIVSGPGRVYGAVLAAGSDAATLILYDNTAGSGTVILKLAAVANTSEAISIPGGVTFSTGCYAAVTGTSPSVTIFY